MKRRYPRATSTSEFIHEAQAQHGTRYDYTPTEYQNSTTKLTIRCREHGLFEQLPHSHLRGSGCPKCGRIKGIRTRRVPHNELIRRFRAAHGELYKYHLVKAVDATTKVTIVCKKHGPFEQTPTGHSAGKGCPKCALLKIGAAKRRSLEQILERFHATHGDRYDYSQVRQVKNSDCKVRILCKRHGAFWQSVDGHLHGNGCPRCRESRGERRVAQTLDRMGFEYVRQKTFSSCRDKRPLPFDFYIPTRRTLIEYDGRQHQVELPVFNFALTQKHDRIKTAWAEENGYPLIRIPHQSFNNIPEILSKKLPCQLSRSELN